MPNRLADELSPYLLQHANNPVDWFPWGEEALQQAKELDRPVFLSIGYAACHWCHVMERESFENPDIADYLNANFISIKVDREDRPDIDQIYMQAVMALRQGQGGWPLSAFLTPDQEVFFGGTYWPPTDRGGMPGFDHVLRQVIRAFTEQRELVIQSAKQLTDYLNASTSLVESGEPGDDLILAVLSRLEESFDAVEGGFGGAPKFPHCMDLQLLIRAQIRCPSDNAALSERLRNMTVTTLDKMADGGIYDHLGGGFARYSVDRQWLVPHFEKMLYDNALLSQVYLAAFLELGIDRYKTVVEETLDYVVRDMVDPCGGFHGTEDADSEGEEGLFYVWTPKEIAQHLDAETARMFCEFYGVSETGNFEGGKSILHRARPIEAWANTWQLEVDELEMKLGVARKRLFEARESRVRPGRDDKVIVSWNGLMIESLARAASALGRTDYLAAAQTCARFIVGQMRNASGRLYHSARHGKMSQDAFVDDYGALINSLVTLYESDLDESWIDHAVSLAETVMKHYYDEQHGAFFFAADDRDPLIARAKDWQDGSVPSGNALIATGLLRLGVLVGRDDFVSASHRTVGLLAGQIEHAPMAGGQTLLAIDLMQAGMSEWVIRSSRNEDAQGVIDAMHRSSYPYRVLSLRAENSDEHRSTHLDSLHESRTTINGEITLFVCRNMECSQPVSGSRSVVEELERIRHDVVPLNTSMGEAT